MKCKKCEGSVIIKDKIVCSRESCASIYHIKCVNLKPDEVKRRSAWLCTTCKVSCCFACNVYTEEHERVKCSICPLVYHNLCVGVTSAGLKNLHDWQCPSCINKQPKTDKSNTPIRNLSSNTSTARAASVFQEGIVSADLMDLRTYIETCNEKVRADLSQISTSLASLTTEFKEKFAKMEEKIGKIHELETELSEAKKRITELESQHVVYMKASIQQLESSVNKQNQYNLRNEIEIAGVDESESESLQHIATLVSKKVGVNLKEEDVDEITRVGPKRGSNSRQAPSKDLLPRTIVVKLVRRTKRNEILQAAKIRRNLTSDGIVEGPSKKLYINERLTKDTRLLFRDARQRSRQHGFRFCWIRDGTIQIRQEEKRPAITIRSSDDLDKHLGPMSAPNSA